MDVINYNQKAWDCEVAKGNIWTKPFDSAVFELAKKGKWDVLLTPQKPVPKDWFPDLKGLKILGLACGGGQQSPLFASLGAEVTVFDNSALQLEQDRIVAKREKLNLSLVQGSMKDLSPFDDNYFDLIFHPVANCFVDDVKIVWNECFRVLKTGGLLLSGFVNPVAYIFDFKAWQEKQQLRVKYAIPYADIKDLAPEDLQKNIAIKEPLEFGHSLTDQIGGQLAAGFSIQGFYEDYGDEMLDPYLASFIAVKAKKP